MTYQPEAVEKERMVRGIQTVVHEHLEVEIGLLQAERLYDHMIEQIGARAYNEGVADAAAWIQTRVLDMEVDLQHVLE